MALQDPRALNLEAQISEALENFVEVNNIRNKALADRDELKLLSTAACGQPDRAGWKGILFGLDKIFLQRL